MLMFVDFLKLQHCLIRLRRLSEFFVFKNIFFYFFRFNWFTWELQIGLRKDDKFYRLSSDGNYHSNDGTEKRFLNNSIVGNDVFGCGHIIPPKNKPNEPTQIFFTLNKKQIGR
ncbi:hypothetical protein ACQ4LE_008999 [Meloidogyne hapla]